MRYVALARRFRPSRFEDVLGQEHVTRTLQNAIRTDRVHHAYLFCGSRGIGKTTVARILARALNDPSGPTADIKALGPDEDQSSLSSADVVEIDGASHTGVDDIRELRESAQYLPAHSRHKIYIIDEVHMLSTSAFNALLKILEEPPEHVVFIFATTEPQKIPATILSRCQRFDFKKVSTSMLVDHLKDLVARDHYSVDDSGLALIARAAEGGVRDALSLLDQVLAFSVDKQAEITAGQIGELLGLADRRVLFELSEALIARDISTGLRLIDRLFNEGHDLVYVAKHFVMHLRDLMLVMNCPDQSEMLIDATDKERAELHAQATVTSELFVREAFARFIRAAEEMATASDSRLLWELVWIEIARSGPSIPLDELLHRFEQLESKLPTSKGGGRPPVSSNKPPSDKAPAPKDTPKSIQHESTAGSGESGLGRLDNGQRWHRLVTSIDGPLMSTFSTGRLMRWDDNEIELAFPADGFELTRAKDKQRREAFEKLCSDYLGHPVRIKVRAIQPAETQTESYRRQSAIEAHELEKSRRRASLREEVENHPATRNVIQQFGATIRRVDIGVE